MQEFSTDTRKIWTVSELNQSARDLLEEHFPGVWVEGEISNFKLYPSGHAYFSLKDDAGQIAAAMFRFSTRDVKFEARNGLAVIARGQLTVYDKRGQYQLIVEGLEPKGKGALQLAFEQLRDRLREEGLFDEERKKELPLLPRKVGVVTSAAGAAVRDIIDVLTRRFSSIEILINPVRVQGEMAAGEIAAAIGEMNARTDIDVLIVGRGGGSIEDLWAFNEEAVARAIAASRIPVVSAVGHETDFTIADFVADLRAPTPSAAAELVVRSKESLEGELGSLARTLSAALRRRVESARHRLESLAVERMISDRRRRLREMAQVTDDFHRDLCREMEGILSVRQNRLAGLRGGPVPPVPPGQTGGLPGEVPACLLQVRKGRRGQCAGEAGAIPTAGGAARGHESAGGARPRVQHLPSLAAPRGRQGCRLGGGGGRREHQTAPGRAAMPRSGHLPA